MKISTSASTSFPRNSFEYTHTHHHRCVELRASSTLIPTKVGVYFMVGWVCRKIEQPALYCLSYSFIRVYSKRYHASASIQLVRRTIFIAANPLAIVDVESWFFFSPNNITRSRHWYMNKPPLTHTHPPPPTNRALTCSFFRFINCNVIQLRRLRTSLLVHAVRTQEQRRGHIVTERRRIGWW